ncbi:DUF222 domain-containing protein [Glutamicibacter sp. 287]|uniref:DUF222 domain-containing protein n=3 Tax=Glutamicibacter TaxID=1742989 RepID=UPI0040342080
MNTTDLDQALDGYGQLLERLHRTDAEACRQIDGAALRAVIEQETQVLIGLRRALQDTADPRLALELLAAAKKIQEECTRMSLVAADRLAATNAHQLEEEELNELRIQPADTTRAARRASGRACFKDPAELLASWLKITYAKAKRMMLDASDLIGRRDPAGQQVPPRFPHLGQLLDDPQVSPEAVCETSKKISRREPEDTTFEGTPTEPTLRDNSGIAVEERAAQILHDELTEKEADKKIGLLITVASATPATSTAAALCRGMYRRQTSNPQVVEFVLRVGLLEAEMIDSLIAQANNPKTQAGQRARQNPAKPGVAQGSDSLPEQPQLPDFLPPEAAGSRWEPEAPQMRVSPPERALNALLELLSTTWVDTGSRRIEPEVIVHMKFDDLRNLAGAQGRTAHGTDLPPGELRKLLCDAKIIPAVFGGRGELLDFGRAKRLVPPSLRKAVLARDRGCLVPGCTAPPERVEIHHIRSYAEGGDTSLENSGPGCDAHHMAFDLGIIKVIFKDGLPWVILPKHIDPEQKPRRNTYWGEDG